MSFTGRMNATALSPLTNGLVSTNAGGYLSRHVASAGYPCVEIVGESDELLAVHITDEDVTFEPIPELPVRSSARRRRRWTSATASEVIRW